MNTFRQTAVGVFVLLGLICVGYLTVKLGKMEVVSDKGFVLSATFNSVSGLRVGADVEVAGVPVGRVTAIDLTSDMRARVSLRLASPMQLSDDTIASVKTSGLIGDKYINLSPGGSPDMLPDGGEITETEAAMVIESIIAKDAHGGV